MSINGLWLRRIVRWLLVALAIYVIGWLFWSARSALLPFTIGVILAYFLLPLVNSLERFIPRWASILTVYLGSLLIVVAFFAYLVPPLLQQASQIIRSFPELEYFEKQAETLLAEYQNMLASLPAEVSEPIRDSVDQGVEQVAQTIQENMTSYVQGIGAFLFNSVFQVITTLIFLLGFFLVPFWLFYVLLDQRAGSEALNRLIPHRARTDFWSIVLITDRVLINYIRGQLILGFVVGLAAGTGLLALNMFGMEIPYVLFLAVFAGITELIPVIGPIIGAIPAIILGLFDSYTTALAVTLLYVAIQQLENQILVPRIIGESVNIHPAILMVLLVVFSQVFGLLGAILCAPAAAAARDVFIYIYGRLNDTPLPAGILPGVKPVPIETSSTVNPRQLAESGADEQPLLEHAPDEHKAAAADETDEQPLLEHTPDGQRSIKKQIPSESSAEK
ncbi:MAG: AI-2E family transporter [Chloroflexales bacterium]|nr:AI-2E family transporter [Chloroflexales bacterium]